MSRKNIPLTDDDFWDDNEGNDDEIVSSVATNGIRNVQITANITNSKTTIPSRNITTSSSSTFSTGSSTPFQTNSSSSSSQSKAPTNKPITSNTNSTVAKNNAPTPNSTTKKPSPLPVPTKGTSASSSRVSPAKSAYSTEGEEEDYFADSDLLDLHYDTVAKVVGEDDFTEDDIVEALRASNYDPHKAIEYLLDEDEYIDEDEEMHNNKGKKIHKQPPSSSASGSVSTPKRSSSSSVSTTPSGNKTPHGGNGLGLGAGLPPLGRTPSSNTTTTTTASNLYVSTPNILRSVASSSSSGGNSTPKAIPSYINQPIPSVPEELLNRIKDEKPRMSIVVVGHVDAGKSTLMGHLLTDIGNVNARTIAKYAKDAKAIGKGSFAYAWVMDASDTERSRGVTVDVGINYFETPRTHFTLLDAPGHRDFVPNMITGVAQADVAILVVDASRGEFEAGFGPGGQTREAAALTRNFGITQLIVAVNKMDANHIEWDESRFTFIVNTLLPYLVSVGYRKENVLFIPVSGLSGINLVKSPQDWLDNLIANGKDTNVTNTAYSTDDDDEYRNHDNDETFSSQNHHHHESADLSEMAADLGFTSSSSSLPKISSTTSLRTASTVSSIDNNDATIAPDRVTGKELRTLLSWYNGEKALTLFQALDTLKPPVRTLDKPFRLAISDIYRHQTQGLTIAGRIESGWIGPQTKLVFVPGNEQGTVKSIAINGLPVTYAGAGDNVDVGIGGIDESVLTPGQMACWITHPIRAIYKFKAQIAILPGLELPLVAGQQFTLHSHTIEEPCNITRILRTLDREGHTKDIKPRFISTNGTVAVVRIRLTRSVPLDLFAEQKRLGRFMLRYSGRTVAAGMILKITG